MTCLCIRATNNTNFGVIILIALPSACAIREPIHRAKEVFTRKMKNVPIEVNPDQRTHQAPPLPPWQRTNSKPNPRMLGPTIPYHSTKQVTITVYLSVDQSAFVSQHNEVVSFMSTVDIRYLVDFYVSLCLGCTHLIQRWLKGEVILLR